MVAAACDFQKDLTDPNQISVTGADPNLIINAVQLDFNDFYRSAAGLVQPLMRHSAMNGGFRYQTAFQPQNQDDAWIRGYQNVLINAKTVLPLAEELNLTTHIAVAKILSAFTYITLVDLFNDVPETDALKAPDGPEFFSPKVDPGSDVYAYAIQLLTEARTELAKTGSDAGAALARDIYYQGDRKKWNALANTLELKAWVNISTQAARKSEADGHIATLLAADIIDTDAENFQYKYSSTTVPDSRHPTYGQYYGPNAGQAGGYIGTSFLYELYWGKTDPNDPTKNLPDPRWRYYVTRQAGSITQIYKIDQKALGCTPTAPPPAHYNGYPFCAFDPGFYGRDHGDASGTPPDGPTITAAGLYPSGGRVDNGAVSDDNTFASKTQRGQGGNGAGITPIWMAFFTDFLKAEIMERNGDAAGAETQLATAIRHSIGYVQGFAKAMGYTSTDTKISGGTVTTADDYVTAVTALYDAAPNKMHIIGREFWLATWGNSMEAYNAYRRTGGPDHLQPPLQQGAGTWQRSLIYPSNFVNLNSTATQKDVDAVNKVFWDGNPETLN